MDISYVMDAFDARVHFSKLLKRLNSSSKSVEAALQFLSEHQDHVEDLYNCMLEELRTVNLTLRINILYLMSALTSSSETYAQMFKTWVRRDIITLIDRTVPTAFVGLANCAPARGVALSWKNDGVISAADLDSVKSLLSQKMNSVKAGQTSSDVMLPEMTRDDILRRMEEDRERTKKRKEMLWATDINTTDEFTIFWEELGAVTKLDEERMLEENRIVEESKMLFSSMDK